MLSTKIQAPGGLDVTSAEALPFPNKPCGVSKRKPTKNKTTIKSRIRDKAKRLPLPANQLDEVILHSVVYSKKRKLKKGEFPHAVWKEKANRRKKK
jgi:hypothetical protein